MARSQMSAPPIVCSSGWVARYAVYSKPNVERFDRLDQRVEILLRREASDEDQIHVGLDILVRPKAIRVDVVRNHLDSVHCGGPPLNEVVRHGLRGHDDPIGGGEYAAFELSRLLGLGRTCPPLPLFEFGPHVPAARDQRFVETPGDLRREGASMRLIRLDQIAR